MMTNTKCESDKYLKVNVITISWSLQSPSKRCQHETSFYHEKIDALRSASAQSVQTLLVHECSTSAASNSTINSTGHILCWPETLPLQLHWPGKFVAKQNELMVCTLCERLRIVLLYIAEIGPLSGAVVPLLAGTPAGQRQHSVHQSVTWVCLCAQCTVKLTGWPKRFLSLSYPLFHTFRSVHEHINSFFFSMRSQFWLCMNVRGSADGDWREKKMHLFVYF